MSKPPRLRLAFSNVFWQSFVVLSVMMEIGLYHRLRPWIQNRSGGFCLRAMAKFSPQMLTRAFLWAAVIAVVLDLYVRLVLRPMYARWYAPRRCEDDFEAFQAFHLGGPETIVSEVPARRQSGRRTERGTLIRTTKSVWFAPNRWDAETWSVPTGQIQSAFARPRPSRFVSWVVGKPDPLVIALHDGSEQVFHVADPSQVLTWISSSSL